MSAKNTNLQNVGSFVTHQQQRGLWFFYGCAVSSIDEGLRSRAVSCGNHIYLRAQENIANQSKLKTSALLWQLCGCKWREKSVFYRVAPAEGNGPYSNPPKMRGTEVGNLHRLAGVKRQNKGAWECFRGPILCIIDSSFSSTVISLKNETKKLLVHILHGRMKSLKNLWHVWKKSLYFSFFFFFLEIILFFCLKIFWWCGKPDATFHQMRWNSEADISNVNARLCLNRGSFWAQLLLREPVWNRMHSYRQTWEKASLHQRSREFQYGDEVLILKPQSHQLRWDCWEVDSLVSVLNKRAFI